jgi:hypothetical protein
MRRIILGLLALLTSAWFFIRDTPALGPGPFDFHLEHLSEVGWKRFVSQRALVCAFLAAAGVALILRGVDDEQQGES